MPDCRLPDLLREAADHHHLAETRLPEHHWADWYGPYVRARLDFEADPPAAVAFADLAILHPNVIA